MVGLVSVDRHGCAGGNRSVAVVGQCAPQPTADGAGGNRAWRRRRYPRVSVPDVGKAAAKSLERHRQIRSTQTRAYTDGVTPILEVTVTAEPTADGRDLIDLLRAVRHQLQLSLGGSRVQVQMLLHRAPNT